MHVLDLFNDKERKFLNGGPLEEAEVKTGMSRAAKGHEKYGKKGMQALAKAGREGAGEKKLDAIRDQHNKYDESVAGPENCWPGHRKVGTKPGTGRNAGKRVNDCEKIKEDDVAEATGDVKFDKILKGITNKKQVAKQQKADTKQQARDAFGNMFGGGNPADKLGIRKKDVGEGMLDNPGEPDSPVAQAIVRRILLQRTDLLAKYGPDRVSAAVDEVADFVGDVDEIGSSDVSGWVRHVEQMLGNMQEQGVAEGTYSTNRLIDKRHLLQKQLTITNDSTERQRIKDQILAIDNDLAATVSDNKDLTRSELEFFARANHDSKTGLAIDRTVPGRTVAKLSNRSPRAYNSKVGPTNTIPNTGRNITQPGQTGRTQPKFDSDGGITEQGADKQKPRIRKYSKMRPDGSKSVRYEVLDYQGRRVSGQGTEGFDDPKNAKEFYYRNYDKPTAGRSTAKKRPQTTSSAGPWAIPISMPTLNHDDHNRYDDEENMPDDEWYRYDDDEENMSDDKWLDSIKIKEATRYWCKDEKRWKDNK